jgi:hypothetical protein
VQEKSDLEWLVNVVPWFRRMAAYPTVVVDFDLLMADPEGQLRRVARGLSLPVDDAVEEGIRAYAASFLKEDMRHTHFDEASLAADPRLNRLTLDAYRWLRRLATGETSLESADFQADWGRIERAVADLAPVLAHVDRLEAELRARGRSPRFWLRHLLTRRPRRARS